ncbi:unnamed protein product [Fusarium langsethiae]|nr:unnamed protein product [Fusarium langsethiae]
MKPVKSHLDFASRNRPGPCFRDLNYTPYDVSNTKSRRQHLTAYFKFMRPEVEGLFQYYAARACSKACKILYEEGKERAVSIPFFEYLVDNIFWKLWFRLYGCDGPKWPWGPPKISPKLRPGEKPSSIYAEYCGGREDEAAKAADAARSVPHAESNPESFIDPDSQYIVRSQAVFTMSGHDKPEPDLDLKKRKAAWEKYGVVAAEPGVVGPFEVELPSLAPIETLVAQDLVAINTLSAGYAIMKTNMTQRRVIVSVSETVETGNEAGQRHLVIWEHVLGWVHLISQNKCVTLYEHLKAFI